MSQMDHPSLLEALIIAGEAALQMRNMGQPERIGTLIERVEAEYDLPADTERVIDMDTLIFATAVGAACEALHGFERKKAAKYLRVIGVLMPDIREALRIAIEIRRRPTA